MYSALQKYSYRLNSHVTQSLGDIVCCATLTIGFSCIYVFSEKVESVKRNHFIAVSHSTKTKTEANVSPLTSKQRVEEDSERLTGKVRGQHDCLVSMETELSCLRCCFHCFQPVVAFTSEHIQKKKLYLTKHCDSRCQEEPHKSTESSWPLEPRWDAPRTQQRATLATSWTLSSAKRAETKNFPNLTNVNKVNSQWRTKVTTGWDEREHEGRIIKKTQFLLPVGGVLSKITSTQKHWNVTLYCYSSFTWRDVSLALSTLLLRTELQVCRVSWVLFLCINAMTFDATFIASGVN